MNCDYERTLSAGGDDGIRTHDPLLAGQVLSQLSYTPIGVCSVVFKEHEEFDNPSKLNNKRRCTLNLVVLGYDSTLEFSQHPIGCCQFSIERR